MIGAGARIEDEATVSHSEAIAWTKYQKFLITTRSVYCVRNPQKAHKGRFNGWFNESRMLTPGFRELYFCSQAPLSLQRRRKWK